MTQSNLKILKQPYSFLKPLLLGFYLFQGSQAIGSVAGLEYERYITPANQLIHFVQVDPAQVSIQSAPAKASGLGRESVTQISKRHDALIGINGGFFQVTKSLAGIPAGVLKIDNQWYSIAYRPRAAIGWSSTQPARIDRIQTKTRVKINQTYYPVHTMNWPDRLHQAILYTPGFGAEIGANRTGTNIQISNQQVAAIDLEGQATIPNNGYLYSIGPHMKRKLSPVSVGDKASVSVQVLPQLNTKTQTEWQRYEHIVGGAPVLIYEGKVIRDFSSESIREDFIHELTARTAIGLLPNGHWLFVVAEQNPFLSSPGISLIELADMMKERGCEFALNLDGGSSSSLYLNDAVLRAHTTPTMTKDDAINYSSLKRVSDAIIVVPKEG